MIYHIENVGCDDYTKFDIELNGDELKLVLDFINKNNDESKYQCQPTINIYLYREDGKYYEQEPINIDN